MKNMLLTSKSMNFMIKLQLIYTHDLFNKKSRKQTVRNQIEENIEDRHV